jgi:hypothetical protein
MSTSIVSLAESFLAEEQAAEIVQAKKQTLRAWRVRRKGPPFYKLNGRVLYKREDLEAWIEGCRVVPGERKPKNRRGRTRTTPLLPAGAGGSRRGSR